MTKTCLLVTVLFAIGCSGNSEPEFPSTVVGNWFICDFGTPNDCEILDDDGIRLTENGEIRKLEESGQGSLPECSGRCFSSALSQIEAVVSEPIGNYSYEGGTLSVIIDGCSEDVTIERNGGSFFLLVNNCDSEFDDSSTDNGSVLRQFSGTTILLNS